MWQETDVFERQTIRRAPDPVAVTTSIERDPAVDETGRGIVYGVLLGAVCWVLIVIAVLVL